MTEAAAVGQIYLQVPPPQGCPRDAEYIFDMHLVNWVGKDSARVAGDDGDVYKIVTTEADSWETPRAPFEVSHPVDGRRFCQTGSWERARRGCPTRG